MNLTLSVIGLFVKAKIGLWLFIYTQNVKLYSTMEKTLKLGISSSLVCVHLGTVHSINLLSALGHTVYTA